MSKFKVGDEIRVGISVVNFYEHSVVKVAYIVDGYYYDKNDIKIFGIRSFAEEKSTLVNQKPEFIETTTRLKAGRFGQLHITNHNDLVKVSVMAMTDSKQVAEVIEQLKQVHELWIGEGK